MLTSNMTIFDAFHYLKPKPSPFPLMRIGGDSDGAYLIPDDLTDVNACFSPGVYRYKYFEDELACSYNIKSHLCDYSTSADEISTPLIENLQTFQQLWLDLSGISNSITLDSWVQSMAPMNYGLGADLLLQMDIEGSEYRTLFTVSTNTISRFRVMAIELHDLEPAVFSKSIKTRMLRYVSMAWALFGKRAAYAFNSSIRSGRFGHLIFRFSSYIEPYLAVPVLRKLAKTHVCVHAHPNNYRGYFIDAISGMNIPEVLEITLLRKDRIPTDGSSFVQPVLPHPMDITNNPGKDPITLNRFWVS